MTGARQIIESQGRTVTWCARQLGIERAEFSRMVNGRRPMAEPVTLRLAALLGVPVDWVRPAEREEVPA